MLPKTHLALVFDLSGYTACHPVRLSHTSCIPDLSTFSLSNALACLRILSDFLAEAQERAGLEDVWSDATTKSSHGTNTHHAQSTRGGVQRWRA